MSDITKYCTVVINLLLIGATDTPLRRPDFAFPNGGLILRGLYINMAERKLENVFCYMRPIFFNRKTLFFFNQN